MNGEGARGAGYCLENSCPGMATAGMRSPHGQRCRDQPQKPGNNRRHALRGFLNSLRRMCLEPGVPLVQQDVRCVSQCILRPFQAGSELSFTRERHWGWGVTAARQLATCRMEYVCPTRAHAAGPVRLNLAVTG